MRTGGFSFPPQRSLLNRPTVVMFCGGGQDSHALIYQYVYEPMFRERYVGDAHFLIVMSDTGDEHDDFYAETLPQLREFCGQQGIEFYFVTSDMGYHSEAWSSLMGQMRRNDNVMGVAFPKSCTDQLKIQVSYRFVADWMRHAYGFSSQGYKTYYEYLHYYGTLLKLPWLKPRGFLLQRPTTVRLHKLRDGMPYRLVFDIPGRINVPIMHGATTGASPLPNRKRQIRFAVATA